MSSLEIALIFLAAAVCTVVAFRLLHLPAVLGYLTAGIVISPFAFSVANQAASLSYLAEFGVVLHSYKRPAGLVLGVACSEPYSADECSVSH